MNYTSRYFRWTPAEQCVFTPLNERRYADLIRFCKQLVTSEGDKQ